MGNSSLFCCLVEFIQLLSSTQSEFEWAPKTTGRSWMKGHLQTAMHSVSSFSLDSNWTEGLTSLAQWPELTCSRSHITKGVSFRGAHGNLCGFERHEHRKKLNLHSLVVSVALVEAVGARGKSATRSMILPWFREFVHVPVRQHNSSAGNHINKPRSQTPILWYTHTHTLLKSFIQSYSVMKYSS